MPPAIASTSYGSTVSAASPTVSGSDVVSEVSTGAPHAIASSGGSPKPSLIDGYAERRCNPSRRRRDRDRRGSRARGCRSRRGERATAANRSSFFQPVPPHEHEMIGRIGRGDRPLERLARAGPGSCAVRTCRRTARSARAARNDARNVLDHRGRCGAKFGFTPSVTSRARAAACGQCSTNWSNVWRDTQMMRSALRDGQRGERLDVEVRTHAVQRRVAERHVVHGDHGRAADAHRQDVVRRVIDVGSHTGDLERHDRLLPEGAAVLGTGPERCAYAADGQAVEAVVGAGHEHGDVVGYAMRQARSRARACSARRPTCARATIGPSARPSSRPLPRRAARPSSAPGPTRPRDRATSSAIRPHGGRPRPGGRAPPAHRATPSIGARTRRRRGGSAIPLSSMTVSVTPPSATATTGTERAIASNGASPSASLRAAYTNTRAPS